MNVSDIDVATLLPHAGEIVLLDHLREVSTDTIIAVTRARNDGLFNNTQDQVPSFIAIEYMAQAIAAWAGYRDQAAGGAIKMGLLLGTREFKANVEYMPVDTELEVKVQSIMEMENGLAVFDGWVAGHGVEISARLSVLSVDSLESLNKGEILG